MSKRKPKQILSTLLLLTLLVACQRPNPSGQTGPTPQPQPTPSAWPRLSVTAQNWQATALTGKTMSDYAEGAADQALFSYPWDVSQNAGGDILIADRFNHRIRRLRAGTVDTFAGQSEPGLTDGQGSSARFNNPQGLGRGFAGELYVADTGSGAVRRIDADGRVSTVVKDLNGPTDVEAAPDGSLYIAEGGKNRILRWRDGTLTPVAGAEQGFADGNGVQAKLFSPRALALAADGKLFIADGFNHAIRVLSPDGRVSTLAGNGQAGNADGDKATARLNEPLALAVDGSGKLLVVDGNARFRLITPEGQVSSLNVIQPLAQPKGLILGTDAIYVADTRLHGVYKLQPAAAP